MSTPSPATTLTYRHLLTAARNIAAAQFALHGFDLVEQAGRGSYSYDLGVAGPGGMMKILVHGSLDGLWDLVAPYLMKTRSQKNDYHRAIDLWMERYRHVTCCLVQFDSANLGGMPRLYLASAAEVAAMLHEETESLGETALHEWQRSLPWRWQFSQERIEELMAEPEEKRPVNFRVPAPERGRDFAQAVPAIA